VTFDSGTLRIVRVLVIALIAVSAMSLAAEVLKPLVVAVLLTFLLMPLVEWCDGWGSPRALSVAVVFLVLFTGIGGVGYVVGDQVASLAEHLPEYEANVRNKLEGMKPRRGSALSKATETIMRLEKSVHAADSQSAAPVRIVSESAVLSWVENVVGPFEIIVTYGGVVLLLLLFMLLEREEIGDRIIQLVGWGSIGVTTKTLNLVGRRLSRYLASLALVNAGFGLTVMLGLWAIGLPYPALWGFLAGLLRFVPYVGTLVAFCLPEMLSIAHFSGWIEPILVLGLFVAAEGITTVVEPLVYSKSTGLSPTGMLVAALFWTWLWGALGLLVANAMTVCLAVIGQSVPALGFLGTLLGRDANLGADLRWYQRVLSRDTDDALDLLEEALKRQRFEDVCDQIVIPTLTRAEADHEQGVIDVQDLRFIYRTVRDWLDDIAQRDELVVADDIALPAGEHLAAQGENTRLTEGLLVGLASGGGEALVLRMIRITLKGSGLRIKILSASGSPLSVSDRVGAIDPALILISHLPAGHHSRVRYLIRRLRARFADLPLVVGHWDAACDPSRVLEDLRSVSVHHVILSVAAARSFIMGRMLAPRGRGAGSPTSGMETAV
jgi:predicted PurR-regulated permease PerM